MQRCPVCETLAERENQSYCLVCAWEFEYFFDELSEINREKYKGKINLHKILYEKSLEIPTVVNEDITTKKSENDMEVFLFMGFFLVSSFNVGLVLESQLGVLTAFSTVNILAFMFLFFGRARLMSYLFFSHIVALSYLIILY